MSRFRSLATTSSKEWIALLRAARLVASAHAVFLVYLAISLAALAVDTASFMLLLAVSPLRPGAAASLAWGIGLLTHYAIARQTLYRTTSTSGSWSTQIRLLLLYAAPSLGGLALTVVVIELCILAGLAPLVAKALAAILSFLLAFVLRQVMFGHSASTRPDAG